MSTTTKDRTTRRFKTVDYRSREHLQYLLMMDAAYRLQVETFEKAKMIERSRKFHGLREVTDEQLSSTLDHFKNKHMRYCNEVSGKPVLNILGSARNEAVSEYGVEFTRALAEEAVPCNLGISSGDWYMGYMGVPKYLFLKLKQAYEAGWAYSMAVPLDGQEMQSESFSSDKKPEWLNGLCKELDLDSDEEWRVFTEMLEEESTSPPHVSFLHRTPTIYYPPQTVGKVYYKPGLGTKEEYHRLRLARQMGKRNITVDSWRPEGTIPWDFIVDEPKRKKKGWVWNFLLEEIETQVDEGTVGLEEFAEQAILRVTEDREFDVPDCFETRYIDSEESLQELIDLTKSDEAPRKPWIIGFSTHYLAAQFVVDRSYATHRRLVEATAKEILKENGDH